MPAASEQLKIPVNERESVTAFLYPAAKKEQAHLTLILAHGAGADQSSEFMQVFAAGLAARGFAALTFNFLYTEQGRRSPDPQPRLESCYEAVVKAALQNKKFKRNRLVVGGKSMGGRVGSQVVAKDAVASGWNDNLAGVLFLGYPLHPPGKPEQRRDQHLKDISAPMLFVQGTRDAFGTPDQLGEVIKRLHLSATLEPIDGGDHSFKIPRTAALSQEQVYDATIDNIAAWLLRLRG